MEKKINIAELLKDCPSGMELDCIDYNGVVTFKEIHDCHKYPILISVKYNDEYFTHTLTKYGQTCMSPYHKCVIFPKGKTTWEGFQRPFKDGDVLVHTQNDRFVMSIYKSNESETIINTYTIFWDRGEGLSVGMQICCYTDSTRLATKEEKEKLFKAIKENGYHWNSDTKTLEKLPKFKVGDRIVDIYRKHLHCDSASGKISQITDDKYIFDDGSYIHIQCQDNWELVPSKFDIATLKPFDKVLVRTDNKHRWSIQFFERLNNVLKDSFVCMGGVRYRQCIPYKGNEHLLNTSNECDKFFNVWEN